MTAIKFNKKWNNQKIDGIFIGRNNSNINYGQTIEISFKDSAIFVSPHDCPGNRDLTYNLLSKTSSGDVTLYDIIPETNTTDFEKVNLLIDNNSKNIQNFHFFQ